MKSLAIFGLGLVTGVGLGILLDEMLACAADDLEAKAAELRRAAILERSATEFRRATSEPNVEPVASFEYYAHPGGPTHPIWAPCDLPHPARIAFARAGLT